MSSIEASSSSNISSGVGASPLGGHPPAGSSIIQNSPHGTPLPTGSVKIDENSVGITEEMASLTLSRKVVAELRAKVATIEEENMHLHAKVSTAASCSEKKLQAVQRENNELKVEIESLRAKTRSLNLTCDDLKPKIGKLQAVVRRARQTREAFLHRLQEIKHLSRFNHKEQQLLTALAKIVEDELQED